MIPRKRYGSKNTDQGVYLGLSKTQVLSPATAGSSSSDIAPLPPPVALVPPLPDTMSCRDRTQEFLSACKSLQSRQNGIQTNKRTLRAVRQRSEFTLMAKRIGKDLSNTFAKLEKLTILAKRKSLFDDKAVEIEELTYIIKQDINSLNKQIAQLQDFVRAKGSQSGRHLQTHSNTIVVSLQSKLASMSNDFKSVLEVRTENLKQQRSRREQFSRAPVSALPLAPNHLGGGAVVLGAESRASGDVAIDMMDSRTSQQLQLIDEIPTSRVGQTPCRILSPQLLSWAPSSSSWHTWLRNRKRPFRGSTRTCWEPSWMLRPPTQRSSSTSSRSPPTGGLWSKSSSSSLCSSSSLWSSLPEPSPL
ncbi:syntaxin-5 isoform X1 [Phocoena phocoena]|uniref:syntaxin-5 isoform X1 n=1 Tax=Phocoena phocoena TaxID=9742 RepID=UPI003307C45D